MAPRTEVVHGSRNDLLAGAGLSFDQNRRVGRGNGFDLLENALQSGARANDFIEAVLTSDLIEQIKIFLCECFFRLAEFLITQGILQTRSQTRKGLN